MAHIPTRRAKGTGRVVSDAEVEQFRAALIAAQDTISFPGRTVDQVIDNVFPLEPPPFTLESRRRRRRSGRQANIVAGDPLRRLGGALGGNVADLGVAVARMLGS